MGTPLAWLLSYDRSYLRSDVVAGLTVGALIVPQSMAYATLAGLPAVTGLYASLLPIAAYAIFSSSRHLSVGPMAVVSLLVASGITAAGISPDSSQYAYYALLLALTSGAIQVMLGLAKLGVLCNYVSNAVTSGFTSAAAIIIGLSQLGPILGVQLGSSKNPLDLLHSAYEKVGAINLPTALMGLVSILLLLYCKKYHPKFPAAIFALSVGTFLTWQFSLEKMGIATVGQVPEGLPAFDILAIDWPIIRGLAPAAVAIALVGFIGSIAVAQTIAMRHRYRVEPNQELLALGLANVAASMSAGFPVTGSLSRTAVNQDAGGKTPASSIVTAAFVALSLLLFTPLFYHLPKAVLASIIVVSSLGLVDLKLPERLFQLRAIDGWTLLLTFVVTLFIGPIEGIFAGVVLSLIVFVHRTAHPHVAELGYRKAQEDFRDVERYPQALTFPGIIILRVDARLYFANASFVHDEIVRRLNDEPELKRVILDLSGVNDIDAVSMASLERLFEQCAERGTPIAMARMKGSVRDMAYLAGWTRSEGEPKTYATINDALEAEGVEL